MFGPGRVAVGSDVAGTLVVRPARTVSWKGTVMVLMRTMVMIMLMMMIVMTTVMVMLVVVMVVLV